MSRFDTPKGLVMDGAGNMIVVDSGNRRIRKVELDTGKVTTIAGSASEGAADNDDPLLATFKAPSGIARASNGDLYISDSGNNKVRKIEAGAGGTYGRVTTIAGTGAQDFDAEDGPGASVAFFKPQGIALVGQTIYLADNEPGFIDKIDISATDYQVKTWLGGGSSKPPATGRNVGLATPFALAAGPDGSLYFTEQLGDVGGIRKASAAGEVTAFAGAGKGDQIGAVATARFDFEALGGALVVGSDGTIYVADTSNHKIKRIKNGQVSMIAGVNPDDDGYFEGAGGAYADGPANAAKFNQPLGLALDERNPAKPVLYVADTGNNRIRKIVLQ
jgi:hypothetical protein